MRAGAQRACTRQSRDGIPDLGRHPVDLDDLLVGLHKLGELFLGNTDLLKKLSNCGRVVDNEPSAVGTAREVYLGARPLAVKINAVRTVNRNFFMRRVTYQEA